MKKIYKCTFHGDDESVIREYLEESNIHYVCHHLGEDYNGLPIKSHFHVISDKFIFGYDEHFTFISEITSSLELGNFISYCENRHCEFQRLKFGPKVAELLLIKTRSATIDDLIDEIVSNCQNSIIKSHSYYLKKYGKVYLFNFKKIREMFDYSSAFYDWTDEKNAKD